MYDTDASTPAAGLGPTTPGASCAADTDCSGQGVYVGKLSGDCGGGRQLQRHCCAAGIASPPACPACVNACGAATGALAPEMPPADSKVWDPPSQAGYGATRFKRRLVAGVAERLELDAGLLRAAIASSGGGERGADAGWILFASALFQHCPSATVP